MSDGFDWVPGAGPARAWDLGHRGGGPEGNGFPNGAGPAEQSQHQLQPQPKAPVFLQVPPLRQPRTTWPPGSQSEAPRRLPAAYMAQCTPRTKEAPESSISSTG